LLQSRSLIDAPYDAISWHAPRIACAWASVGELALTMQAFGTQRRVMTLGESTRSPRCTTNRLRFAKVRRNLLAVDHCFEVG
jgi:hypothetical protein